MKEESKHIEKHLFICTNHRDVGECCANKNAEEIFKQLKEKSKQDPAWKGIISVTRCGCLGFCDKGVAAVVYPERKWLTEINSANDLYKV